MQDISFHISGLHAEAIATHLILVLHNFVQGKKAGSIAEPDLQRLEQLDKTYQKFKTLTGQPDDETPQKITLTIEEAEALINAFTAPDFKKAALADEYYQKHSYAAYFQQIYANYLREVGASYIEALAA